MGIPNIHTTIDYAALIKAQSNQVIGKVPVEKNYKLKTKIKTINKNYRRRTK